MNNHENPNTTAVNPPGLPLTRRKLLQAAGAAAGFASQFGCGEAAGKVPPNIVWIIADDLSPELGCYGNQLVKTPSLDRLAREGTRFTNAFVTAPVCSPSRSAMITGMYQTSIGAHNHRSHRDDGYTLPAPVRLVTGYLREAGYYTTNEEDTGFGSSGKTDYNFTAENPFDGADWRERNPGQPFYAQVNIREPHRWGAPNVWKGSQGLAERIDPAKVTLPPFYPDHPVARKDWAGYLDEIGILDEKVGRVLDRLDEEGLSDDTLVIFIGDHGRAHPRDKQFLYDGGILVPLIVRWPGVVEPGAVSDELVSSIDLAATSLSAAGIARPGYMEGQVFVGPERAAPREYIVAARDRCDETVDRIRCVRDKRYKYIRNFQPERPYMQMNRYKEVSYPIWRLMKRLHEENKLTPEQALFLAETRPSEELYDVEADPHEVHNLAESAEHKEVLTKMQETLNSWIAETGDQGEIAEDPAIAAYWEKRMAENYAEQFPQVYELDKKEMEAAATSE